MTNKLATKPENELLISIAQQQELQVGINKILASEVSKSKAEIKAYVDEQIAEIKKITPLSDGEAMSLKKTISSRAAVTTKVWIKKQFGSEDYGGQNLFSKKYGHIIRYFYHVIKHEFNAIKYTAILHAQIDDAIAFANQLNYTTLNAATKRVTPAQLATVNDWEKRHGLTLTELVED